ncbi:hypothetical protein [Henriciella pelagia]|uniref:hypothetical protein n=1 Tax=Henriciella pelagia TaxID=1977912 RepID=UPI0035122395
MSSKSDWTIEYDNDVGPNDDYFVQWWDVSNGEKSYRCSTEADAVELKALLDRSGSPVPGGWRSDSANPVHEPPAIWYSYNKLTDDENVSDVQLPEHVKYIRADLASATPDRFTEQNEESVEQLCAERVSDRVAELEGEVARLRDALNDVCGMAHDIAYPMDKIGPGLSLNDKVRRIKRHARQALGGQSHE